MKPQTLKTLKANDRSWFGDDYHYTYELSGKEHIIDEVSFEEDYHPFYVKGICGTTFKTRYKDTAANLDMSKELSCFKCVKKAGFVQYHAPLYLEPHKENSPQVGKYYKVLIAFDIYKKGDIYSYYYRTV